MLPFVGFSKAKGKAAMGQGPILPRLQEQIKAFLSVPSPMGLAFSVPAPGFPPKSSLWA